MNLLWIKTPPFIRILFPNHIWKISNSKNKVYLTFDDGPIPDVTEWVLDILKNENIKATFFCIGDNIRKNPTVFNRICNEGHSIGNHTFNHLKGWKTSYKTYLENFEKCEDEISSKLDTTKARLFRPPYGKIKLKQSKSIRKKGYKIIMWDVLSYDFDPNTTKKRCLENVIKNTTSGSIIVFHDSLKAKKNLQYALPKAIQFLKEKGFIFDIID